ncbi:hypothetical protein HanRHA438_Chr11g0515131 [Helianthus annuus]|nr:hypothetical protein HanHA300_Chr11g0412591 [Helianthus annuus]KAJ0510449.1 hypothetical protein HanIR_Chr11g0540931 [Helianthus annuus]KAJ0518332.1 hypothetical protein HanHA89_Chr11g0436251 [Helianthus annuus]KAJ0686365.1 hypothetical protein HanLR1_Chr11g0413921 [Helianthus annuus]KAJ0690186.1 hypothetical protein HanOQP8_Chr11g0415021 [Helianthus annuus]
MFWSRIGGDEGYGCMIGVSRNGGLSSKRSRLGFRRVSGNSIQFCVCQHPTDADGSGERPLYLEDAGGLA